MSRAVVSLLTTAVIAIAALGTLLIWHFVRRARLIRAGLNPPRPVRWPEINREPAPRTGTGADPNPLADTDTNLESL